MSHIPSQPNLDFSTPQHSWSVRFWSLIVVAGAAAGLVGGFLMRLLHAVEHLAWNFRTGTFLEAVSNVSAVHRILILFAAGILVGVSQILNRKIFSVSGEVDSAIWFRSGRMPLIATLAQAIQSIVIVGMGASLGRESAIKQAAGAIASALAQLSQLSRAEQRVLVACGVGAGMAAAYNVPVGGALFAVEILIGSISLRLALPALVCSAIATATSWILLPTGPVYDVPEYPLSISLMVWSVWAGPVLGLLTVLLVRAIAWSEDHKPAGNIRIFMVPAVVFSLLGLASTVYPQLLGNGQDAVQLALNADFRFSLLLVLPLLKALATTGCLTSGAHGGLFTPTMAIGALLGGLLGHAWDCIWPGASMGCCSVIGAGAFLAAASQGPVSALALVLELTRHVDATMVPMLLAVSGAMLVARRFESDSIYSLRIRSTNPRPEPTPSDRLPSFEHLISRDFSVISAATGYGELLRGLLLSAIEYPLYVVDHEGILLGRIDAKSLNITELGPLPLEAAKAADFARPLKSLDSQMSEQDVRESFAKVGDPHLPVIDSKTGRLIGIVKRNAQNTAQPQPAAQARENVQDPWLARRAEE